MPSEPITVHLAGALHDGARGHVVDAALAVCGGRVVDVGPRAAVFSSLDGAAVDVVQHRGAILPGFVDAHVHLLRSARDANAVDCRGARTVGDVCALVAQRAASLPRDAWVEAAGYHQDDLVERRHPTADELAAAAGRPVRLRHSSGHGVILSTSALRRCGIDSATPDPPGGRIERDGDGVPTGLLLGRAAALARRRHSTDELHAEVDALSSRWHALGITTLCDAGAENDVTTLATLASLVRGGVLRQRIVVMRGAGDALSAGRPTSPWEMPPGVEGRVVAGPVKFMVDQVDGMRTLDADSLAAAVATLGAAGRPCAVHAAGLEAVAVSVAALERAGPPAGGGRHRVEHCSPLPDGLLEPLRRSGAAIVMHPLFVERHGDRYLLDEDEQPPDWIYRCATLLTAGVPVAAGSDAPTTEPSPMQSIAAAMRRRTLAGRVLGPDERVDAATAIALHTGWAAAVCGLDSAGILRPGCVADFVVVPVDPARLSAGEIAQLPVTATWTGGIAAVAELLPC